MFLAYRLLPLETTGQCQLYDLLDRNRVFAQVITAQFSLEGLRRLELADECDSWSVD